MRLTIVLDTDDSEQPDDAKEKAMVDAMRIVKDWASHGAEKLGDAASNNPLTGRETKGVIQALLDKGNFNDNARDVKAKFERLNNLEGPIGGDSTDLGKKYDRSDAWKALKDDANSEHFNNFLLACRADIDEEQFQPINMIRQRPIVPGSDLHRLWQQGESGTEWNKLKDRIQGVTQYDESPEGERKEVPSAIFFNKAWIDEQRSRNPPFYAWTDELFSEVTDKDALTTFAKKGEGVKDSKGRDLHIRPADALYDKSFHRSLFHELFHLKAFGDMHDDESDDSHGAYGFANNAELQNRENPDLLTIIATNIELVKSNGYIVGLDGSAKKK
ncbi:MAG: hypothetical protein Q9160_009136 [Pyrenula sp. 1 TL-2023]